MITYRHIWVHGSRFTIKTTSQDRIQLEPMPHSLFWSKPETNADKTTQQWAKARRNTIVSGPDGKYCFANVRNIRKWANHFGLLYLRGER